MRKLLASTAFALISLSASAMAAPDISGTWQGKSDRNRQYVLKVTKAAAGTFRADFYNLGRERAAETLNGNSISSISTTNGHFQP
jgi:hypothetical protein